MEVDGAPGCLIADTSMFLLLGATTQVTLLPATGPAGWTIQRCWTLQKWRREAASPPAPGSVPFPVKGDKHEPLPCCWSQGDPLGTSLWSLWLHSGREASGSNRGWGWLWGLCLPHLRGDQQLPGNACFWLLCRLKPTQLPPRTDRNPRQPVRSY